MTYMDNKSEAIVRQTLEFLKPMSLLPTIIGWVILLTPPFIHRIVANDWRKGLFPWVGIPAEPKVVFLLGYAAMFGAVIVLIAVAVFLAKNSKHPVMGKTAIVSLAIVIMIGACGAVGLQMIEANRNLLAGILLFIPVIIISLKLWFGKALRNRRK